MGSRKKLDGILHLTHGGNLIKMTQFLFVLQPSDNWSMNQLDPIEWFNKVYEKLRPITDRKFIVRPHPNHVVAMENRKGDFSGRC